MNKEKNSKKIDNFKSFELPKKQAEKAAGGFIFRMIEFSTTATVNMICYGNINGSGRRRF